MIGKIHVLYDHIFMHIFILFSFHYICNFISFVFRKDFDVEIISLGFQNYISAFIRLFFFQGYYLISLFRGLMFHDPNMKPKKIHGYTQKRNGSLNRLKSTSLSLSVH